MANVNAMAWSAALVAVTAAMAIGCGPSFLDRAAAEPGAVKSPTGLVMRTLVEGAGEAPKESDTVRVHYVGQFIDGVVFDSSVERNKPAEFPVGKVIACWTEGLQKMKAGGKSRLVCPSDLAYGDQGRPTIPPGAALIFDVELLEVK